MLQTRITDLLKIRYPIIQAPMAGGVTTPELVAAVSNVGGLGMLGAGYMSPRQILVSIEHIRSLTEGPFGVNLFIPQHYDVNAPDLDAMTTNLDTFRDNLGIPASPPLPNFAEPFAEQLEAVLSAGIKVLSFTFGIPDPMVMANLRTYGTYIMGTATTVSEAIQLQRAGVNAIVAQGSEAGGHRGTFSHAEESALIGTMALIPQVIDHVSIPVIAAGGIMDGRGLAASLMLGADGVQMGTAFLASPESGAHPSYKQALEHATEEQTAVTKAYSGKAARGIETSFMQQMSTYGGRIPPYPIQNALTRDIRQEAAKQNNPDYMSLWAGQGLRLVKTRPASCVVEETAQEAEHIIQRFSSR